MNTLTQTNTTSTSDFLNRIQGPATALARVLIALMFILAGFDKLTHFSHTVGYVSSVGLPFPSVMTALAMITELGAGFALIFGLKTRVAAFLLFGFTLIASFIFHQFWAVPADQAFVTQLLFLKNISVAGGLLFIAFNAKQ